MPPIADHPLRYAMANELHARPFPTVETPSRAAYLAIKPAENAAGRDRGADRAHLIDLLDRFGAQHPQPDATHYFGQIGKHFLKWESHTEFVTYTIFGKGLAERPFDAATFAVFPEDWLAAAPGSRVTSALIRIEEADGDDGIREKVDDWLVPESLAISRVLENDLVLAGDFRIDTAGHMRFAVFARPGTGNRRVGRVVQRLCEIETYKAMSMLGLSRARALSPQLSAIDITLTRLLGDMCGPIAEPAAMLQSLLEVSAELENIVAQSSFRFGATGAYETIVHQRIAVLREERFGGRQTFSEFMMRRFDPAMRTVKSTERRLQAMSDRALRAGDLLRTRVDVERSAQNQELLTSMDRRADLQLRLQRTVEGLSVVAISYYAVNLVLYMTGPLEKTLDIPKTVMAAIATPFVLLMVWFLVKRIREKVEK
ncbi:DUF3422 family protein [Yoonia sp.]|uniref:DUF3422 family protein n=1 Tax=Yoonia sp. TaxID=2212373 RepID=UPI0019DA4D50|nr:DUF3422 domain-containing protein [Yoonia sp.]MBE0413978.1 DUF3422 domain-containing protein [Yoonia sp.]